MNQGTITFILPFTHQQHLHMIESGRHKCNDRAQLLIRLTTQIHCTQGQLFTVHKHQGNCSLYTNTRATVHCSLNTNKGHCLLYTNTRATVHFTQTQGPLFTVHKHKGQPCWQPSDPLNRISVTPCPSFCFGLKPGVKITW